MWSFPGGFSYLHFCPTFSPRKARAHQQVDQVAKAAMAKVHMALFPAIPDGKFPWIPKKTASENPPGGKAFFLGAWMDACPQKMWLFFFNQIVTWQILGKSSLTSEQPLEI